ncbi:peptidase M28 [Alsobacter soli]|uniref:Peptidase M28 n=1 Tax=Alsobacter soli TaxID=2109933 RepID=A0A2T1HQR2_9HYPH|nr:DUF4910 domain-containing protein [Alsobacter soli]PSC03993.1 peptidase M28 [Alsobacter soli]
MATPGANLASRLSGGGVGEEIYDLAARIFPICRSITGDGVRATLRELGGRAPIAVREVPSGTQVFDWTIPPEWVIREAWIKDPSGRKVVDFADCNLHVLNYSAPVRARLPLAQLREHVFTLPDQPDLIPYRTSYYAERWGFCMSHRQLEALPEGEYEVCVDSEFRPGSLTYGEVVKQGATADEVLLSAHICHPSLANDNCSGLALLATLANRLQAVETRYTYRLIFAPGSIGAIAWLALNRDRAARIRHGLVLSCVGDAGAPNYKRSRQGEAVIDRAMAHVLRHQAPGSRVLDFSPYGYDERQYCSPGFDLPVGLFQRSLFGTFPEYHTSADNLSFIAPEHLASSYDLIVAALDILEGDRLLKRTRPECEPQLGKYGLYGSVGGAPASPDRHMALLWTLNLADGRHTLLDMAERSGLPFASICAAADAALGAGLLVDAP